MVQTEKEGEGERDREREGKESLLLNPQTRAAAARERDHEFHPPFHCLTRSKPTLGIEFRRVLENRLVVVNVVDCHTDACSFWHEPAIW